MEGSSVVIGAQPFGYGPAAKALALAGCLRARGWRPVLAAQGIALELVSKEPRAFAETLDLGRQQAEVRRRVAAARAVVSVMDRELCGMARQLGRDFHVVDSLFWIREQVPGEFASARRYWGQRFPVRPTGDSLPGPAVELVGPILEPHTPGPPPAPADSSLVINLGGGESPVREASFFARYAELVIDAFLSSRLADEPFESVTVLAGERLTAALQRGYRQTRMRFVSVPHRTAQQLLARATLVLTAPGLTTSLECFRHAVTTRFLPPQSYSQWRILESLQQRGLAPGALHWKELDPDGFRGGLAAEPQRNRHLHRVLDRLLARADSRRRLSAKLGPLSATEARDLVARQSAFFAQLGRNGAEEIAEALAG